MRIVQITPGAGAMICGNCIRDNALVAAFRKSGHDAIMLPLYLPLTLDEDDQSAEMPVFFGGINVYLEQKSGLRLPGFLHRLLASRPLLKWAAGRAASTRPAEVGEIALSMLRGEQGRQGRELDELVAWLKTQPRPDVICLSNALLLGLARRLRTELQVPIVCMLQGEDTFLDALPETYRAACWQTLTERATDVDLFISPSRYFADLMTRRLGLRSERVQVVHNGINLAGYPASTDASRASYHTAPVLGFFARMCREKGLATLVEAFILIKQRNRVPRLKLHVGGYCSPADELYVKTLRQRLTDAGFNDEAVFFPNLSRTEKLDFFRALSVFSVPALYGEAFGLYVLEALAAGVPVVQPRTAAFPELVEATHGGVLCEPDNPAALADAIEELLLHPPRARVMGETGRHAVFEQFSAEAMAHRTLSAFAAAVDYFNRKS